MIGFFVGLTAINYISDVSVRDMLVTMDSGTDLSEYGIFVNAEGDDIEEMEQQLLSQFQDADSDVTHRRLSAPRVGVCSMDKT